MKRLAFSWLLACFAIRSFAAGAFDMGSAIEDGSLWSADPVLFVKAHQDQGLKFTSDDRMSADSRRDGGFTCFGLPVYETRVSFGEAGGIVRVELMLFDKGGTEALEKIDAGGGSQLMHLARKDGKISREDFFGALKTVRAKLTKKGSKNPTPVDERTSDAKIVERTQTWVKSQLGVSAELKWNYTQEGKKDETFQAGFIRFAVNSPSLAGTSSASAAGGKAEAKGVKTIVDNIIRDPRGDVFIDNVPMVDQGAKGYCAVSAAERVMRYYGLDVDEHQIAEAAGTSAESGTSTLAMKQSVEAIGKKYKLATVLLYGDFEADTATRIANINKEVAAYNKAAKKLKKAAITEEQYVTHQGNTTMFDPGKVDDLMDAEVRKYMRTEGSMKSKFTKFKKDIHQYVDMGMPIFWGVNLGIYPESDIPQAKGGHMRLIIGYNDKKNELLYTDTWGKGHELKRMPIDWAWTISHCLMVMKPLK